MNVPIPRAEYAPPPTPEALPGLMVCYEVGGLFTIGPDTAERIVVGALSKITQAGASRLLTEVQPVAVPGDMSESLDPSLWYAMGVPPPMRRRQQTVLLTGRTLRTHHLGWRQWVQDTAGPDELPGLDRPFCAAVTVADPHAWNAPCPELAEQITVLRGAHALGHGLNMRSQLDHCTSPLCLMGPVDPDQQGQLDGFTITNGRTFCGDCIDLVRR